MIMKFNFSHALEEIVSRAAIPLPSRSLQFPPPPDTADHVKNTSSFGAILQL